MPQSSSNGTNGGLGFEQTLWAAADKLRGHLDAAEYKNVVLGLIFLKYISDAFEEKYEQLTLWTQDPEHPYYVDAPRYRQLDGRVRTNPSGLTTLSGKTQFERTLAPR